jgi:exopolysaccharide biosynthesis polyprenyl glycosylphosphotransferase
MNGAYESFRTKEVAELLHTVFKSAFLGLLLIATVLYFVQPGLDKDFVAFTFMMASFFLCLYKCLLLWFFQSLRKSGVNYRNILIAGSGERAKCFIDLIKNNAEWGFKIIGIVDADKGRVGMNVREVPIIGSFDDLPEILHNNVVDEVVFIVPRSWLESISDLISHCETVGVASSIALDLFDLKIAKSKQIDLHGFPLVAFEPTPTHFWALLFKRIFDIVVASAGLIILAPVFLLVSIFIKTTSSGSVLFRQKRKGLHGRIFTLYKFRTMYEDAEKRLHELMKYNEMEGPVFKLENDPRITKIGKILRKFSLDEFPQLWNVLMGDMSIIGPRPPLASEVDLYEDWQKRRLSMRPGLTCLWQVNGRNKITDFKQWAALDLQYIDNWSLLMDFKIFFKTIPVVLFGIGAK